MSNATPDPDLKIIIIGAGTGGLCLAHGLKRAGIAVEVYERDRTRRDGLQGYRVGIDPDGSRALECQPAARAVRDLPRHLRHPPTYFNMLTEKLRRAARALTASRPRPASTASARSAA